MSEKYTVNINISSGTDFRQLYYLTNPDLSPKDISGFKFSANIAKHSRAYHATTSTSDEMDWNYSSFHCYVEDSLNGVFSLNMSANNTFKLKEGKYVYSVTGRTTNGELFEPVSGVAFVSTAFGVKDPNYPGRVLVSDTVPRDKELGALWFNTTNSRLYIWLSNAWVDLTTTGASPSVVERLSPPPTPVENEVWYNKSNGKIYIWTKDKLGNYSWVDATRFG